MTAPHVRPRITTPVRIKPLRLRILDFLATHPGPHSIAEIGRAVACPKRNNLYTQLPQLVKTGEIVRCGVGTYARRTGARATKEKKDLFRYTLGDRVGVRRSPETYTIQAQHYVRHIDMRDALVLYDLKDNRGNQILRIAEMHLTAPPQWARPAHGGKA